MAPATTRSPSVSVHPKKLENEKQVEETTRETGNDRNRSRGKWTSDPSHTTKALQTHAENTRHTEVRPAGFQVYDVLEKPKLVHGDVNQSSVVMEIDQEGV